MARFWVARFGFDPDKVVITGYARMDRLVRQDEDVQVIRRRLGLDEQDTGNITLFAPTWKNDGAGRSIFPFGLRPHTFLQALSCVAQRTGSTVVVRTHLNSGATSHGRYPRVRWIPFADYPDTEAMLLASDVLICDWSSIAFDWILLDRPTLFLDVEAPYAKGFILEGRHRYGAIVGSLDALTRDLENYLREPGDYQARYGERVTTIRNEVLDECADGDAARRCVKRLKMHLSGSRNT
jgi:CDP-glycerol glycerophosphotransferase